MKRSREYRPEIDGLRAVAVLSVIFYHLEVPGFSGGYVGVDIFFVISGYLISKNISTQIHDGDFSFYSFYLNRFRRLFPALIFTVLVSLLLGYLLFSPDHFARLGASSVFSTVSMSNMFFWKEAGYFDTSASFKPLLHTWSLSVEEQFYLAWPALLVVTTRINKTARNLTLFAAGVSSLYFAEKFLSIDPAAAYFWAPFRIVEFSIGAILVFWGRDRLRHANYEELLFALGLMLAVIPVFVFSSRTPFPGLYALIPCIGAAILIFSGRARLLGGILRSKYVVGIGLISYSLYLVHWPIIVFYRYWKLGGLGPQSQILLLVITFIAAGLMYSLIEKRFRYPRQKKHSVADFSFVFIILITVFLGVAVWSGKGWPWRYSESTLALIHSVSDLDAKRQLTLDYAADAQEGQIPKTGVPLYLIIGDSFSKGVFNALKIVKPEINLMQLQIEAMCQPIIPGDYGNTSPNSDINEQYCNNERIRVFESELLEQASYIMLIASWREPGLAAIERTVAYLQQVSSANIVIFGARPTFHDVPSLALRYGRFEGMDEFVNRYKSPLVDKDNAILKNVANSTGVTFIDIYALMCGNKVCPVFSDSNKIMYYDQAHWTIEGAKYFGQKLIDVKPEFLNYTLLN